MIKSAKAVDPAAEYVWKFSGSPIRIHVAISVISELRQQLNSDTSVLILHRKKRSEDYSLAEYETGG